MLGPIDHGMCKSIYFAGLEGLTLEIATAEKAIDGRAWIDPEVADLVGISAEEMERFKKPAAYAGEGGAVAQPPIDASKPHLKYEQDVYEKLVAMPDEKILAKFSDTEPPVAVSKAG